MLNNDQIFELIKMIEYDVGPVGISLNAETNFQFLIAVIMSAQTTDVAVNKVTPKLFQKYPTAEKMQYANQDDIENIIRSIGLYKNKSKNIIATSKMLVSDFNGKVPDNREDLIKLPGVGRKTANVVLSDRFNQPTFAVDTHVEKISKRLHFVDPNASVIAIENRIVDALPDNELHTAHHSLIEFGRKYNIKTLDNQITQLSDQMFEKNKKARTQ
ncbi:endonuclease III domain-containing protein [Companilactobacillus metriopterae]|uniref:endonuclease III domain-containing protein n=1 Tax=Companilactobacillus metriopterae TaxID=1909267 RepID=UPI00100B1520|nr:endonuclease III [Companilactobacillus metriopterae]